MSENAKTVYVVAEGHTYAVEVDWNWPYDRKDYGKSSRVYVSGEPKPAWAHPPFTFKGENPNMDLAWKAYNQEELRLQRAILEPALRAAELGFLLEGIKWSRRAGCSCGCSPGWIAPASQSRNFHVTVKLGMLPEVQERISIQNFQGGSEADEAARRYAEDEEPEYDPPVRFETDAYGVPFGVNL